MEALDIKDDSLEVIISEKNLIGPSSFSFLADGTILIVDECAHQLKIFSEGELKKTIGKKGKDRDSFFYPTDAAIVDHVIYVTDRFNHKVKAVDLEGKLIWETGGYGSEKGLLIEPVGIAHYDKNTLAVTDMGNARIVFFDMNGKFLHAFGKRGIEKEYYESTSFKTKFIYKAWAGSFNRFATIDTSFFVSGYDTGTLDTPKGIAADNDHIAVCDYSGRIQVFHKDGKLKNTFINDKEKLFSYAQWLQIKEGKILFSKELGDAVYCVDEKGNVDLFLKTPGHFIECFRFHGDDIYFMSPWERKMFRLKTPDTRIKTEKKQKEGLATKGH
ncbi:MAG: NHL repeat-containing protein [Candidatus Aureabacteria bacterium]|nr:NHL repeat-containing protein [Candidatus Auribacterota bacterium]